MAAKTNPYMPTMAKIEQVTSLTKDTKLFKIKYPMNHMPGQFVEISVLGVGECPISICSDSRIFTEVTVRDVGTVTKAMFSLKEKDSIGIRGPYGNGYPMKSFERKNIVIVAGGTGVAPMRGVIKFLENNRKSYPDVQLFFGFRSPEDILFKKEIEKWSTTFNLGLTVDKKNASWKGKVGVVTDLISKSKITGEDTVALVCGPPIMTKFAIQSLLEKGIDKSNIWLSLERDMKCGIGKCGHCQINNKYVCKDGPVFNYTEIENVKEE